MCRHKTTEQLAEQTREMITTHSNAEIADKLKVSISSIKRIIREKGLVRTREQEESIRSRTRKDLVRAERRRAIFGLDQKTDIKVFTNRERNKLKYCLRRRKYIFFKRGETTAYFDRNTNRHPQYEERGRKLGLRFIQLETK